MDEAHKMAAYRYGKKVNKTQRYEFGEFLRERTDHFLFLTATPHKGDPDNFALLLQLLDRICTSPATSWPKPVPTTRTAS